MPAEDILETQTGGTGETVQSGTPVIKESELPEKVSVPEAPIPQTTPSPLPVDSVPQPTVEQQPTAPSIEPTPPPPAPRVNNEYWEKVYNYSMSNPKIKLSLSYEDFVSKFSESDEKLNRLYNGLRKESRHLPADFEMSSFGQFKNNSFLQFSKKQAIFVGITAHKTGRA